MHETTDTSDRANLQSLEPTHPSQRRLRKRLTLRGELLLAMLPTLTVLGVLATVEVVTEQRLLFASLASSAFLIYLDPEHGTNSIRTLALAHLTAAFLGWTTYSLLGSGYVSAGSAMVLTILLMILMDAVHPPAVATAMGFALTPPAPPAETWSRSRNVTVTRSAREKVAHSPIATETSDESLSPLNPSEDTVTCVTHVAGGATPKRGSMAR